MSQEEFISWAIVLMGLIIGLAGIAWGGFSLFKMKRENDADQMEFDWTSILIAAGLIYAGIRIMIWGQNFPDR